MNYLKLAKTVACFRESAIQGRGEMAASEGGRQAEPTVGSSVGQVGPPGLSLGSRATTSGGGEIRTDSRI